MLIKFLKFSVSGIFVLGLVLTVLYLYADNKKDIGANFREQIETGSVLEANITFNAIITCCKFLTKKPPNIFGGVFVGNQIILAPFILY